MSKVKKATKVAALYAHVVLDRSGSMMTCRAEAVSGYNAYVGGLDKGSRVSLTIFDGQSVDMIRDAVDPKAAAITEGEFVPRGMTPLYDAVGQTVGKIGARTKKGDRVALVILTDGEENASHEWTAPKLKELLKGKQENDGWLVIYLGANQDAWAVGQAFGTVAANTMSYDTSNLQASMASVGRATQSYAVAESAAAGRMSSTFTTDERLKAIKR